MKLKVLSFLRVLVFALCVVTVTDVVTMPVAEARPGGGRSMGRMGSGFRRSAPPPSYSNPSGNKQPGGNYNYNQQPQQPGQRGGFMRGLVGGLAGGFLGSMLFGSLAHGLGLGGMGTGGVGLFEILLLAGGAFLIYRMFANRRQQVAAAATSAPGYNYQVDAVPQESGYKSAAPFFAHTQGTLDRETASDLFFKVQGAWTRRDLASVVGMLSPEIRDELERDLALLKSAGRINRLENISVRNVEVVEEWQEQGEAFATVRYDANLLDYVVDEKTNSVVEGSTTEPVKFSEEWTFKKTGSVWTLVGIAQVAH